MHATSDTPEARQPVRVGRRHFFRTTLLALGGAMLWPLRWAHAKKVGIKQASVPALAQVGGSAVISVKGHDLLLIRDTQTSVKALDPMCTHKKCQVRYQPQTNDIGCKCHKSKFLLDGTVVSGPAPAPLTTFPSHMAGDQIVVTLPE